LVEIYKTFKEDVHKIYLEKIGEKLLACEKGEELIQVKEETKPIVYKGEVIRPKGFEVTTGALILLSELISVNKEILDPYLVILHNIVNLKKTNFYDSMIQYAWKVFNRAFVIWDKKSIKNELEIILESLFRDVKNPKPSVSNEAAQVIKTIAAKIGANILKARVEDAFGGSYSQQLETILSSPYQ